MCVFQLFCGNEIKQTPCEIENKDYSFCKQGSVKESKLPFSEIL